MATIRLNADASAAMLKVAKAYDEAHDMNRGEMGVALILAGCTLLSVSLNDVQIDEVFAYIKDKTAVLRKPNAS